MIVTAYNCLMASPVTVISFRKFITQWLDQW